MVDKLTGGQWVTDYWTTTPSFNSYAPGLGDCNQAPQPTGRTWGQTRSYNAGVAGQCTWGAYEQFKAATATRMEGYLNAAHPLVDEVTRKVEASIKR